MIADRPGALGWPRPIGRPPFHRPVGRRDARPVAGEVRRGGGVVAGLTDAEVDAILDVGRGEGGGIVLAGASAAKRWC